MDNRIRHRGICCCILWCLLFGGLWSTASLAEQRPQAPSFSLKLYGGDLSPSNVASTISLSDYRNQVVLVNFWASWCMPCVQELPAMQTLRRNMADQPFEILALNVGEEPEQIESFLRAFGSQLNFPILLHAEFWVADDFRVKALPTSVLIDKQGRIVELVVGPRKWDSAAAESLMMALVAE